MVCTRIGEGGKLVITGDCEQSDLRNGGHHLELIANEMERAGEAGVIRFTARGSRHPRINQVVRQVHGQTDSSPLQPGKAVSGSAGSLSLNATL